MLKSISGSVVTLLATGVGAYTYACRKAEQNNGAYIINRNEHSCFKFFKPSPKLEKYLQVECFENASCQQEYNDCIASMTKR